MGSGSFFGSFCAEKRTGALAGQGDRPMFADFAANIGTVPVNGYERNAMTDATQRVPPLPRPLRAQGATCFQPFRCKQRGESP